MMIRTRERLGRPGNYYSRGIVVGQAWALEEEDGGLSSDRSGGRRRWNRRRRPSGERERDRLESVCCLGGLFVDGVFLRVAEGREVK